MTAPADRRMVVSNRIAMSTLASRMTGGTSGSGPRLRQADPVAYADLVASMSDRRAGLSIALGTPMGEIDRNGYRVRGGAA